MKIMTLGVASTLLALMGAPAQAIEPSELAYQIAKSHLLVDTHIDVPYRLNEQWEDVTQATPSGDFDYPRAVQGGLNAPFMSIYIPASYEKTDGGVALANKLIDSVEAIVGRAPDKFALVYSAQDVEDAFAQGKIALPMGMENGSPMAGKIDNLHYFYQRGIRYITLAHSQSNHISDSSYDLRRQWKGLSPFGKKLVKEMNKIGMMVDISHISDAAFYQVMDISTAPVIASHSSLRKFTPGFERNMDDDMLKALAKNGGVIQINFGSSFINQSAQNWYTKRSSLLKDKQLEGDAASQFRKQYAQQNPFPFASLEDVLDHIDYVRDLIGIEHIGIGSDYDGVGDSLPENLKDVSYYPHLVQGLLDRGYSQSDIVKILSGNVMRVWKEVERIASQKV